MLFRQMSGWVASSIRRSRPCVAHSLRCGAHKGTYGHICRVSGMQRISSSSVVPGMNGKADVSPEVPLHTRNIRKFILITLTHAEVRSKVTRSLCVARCRDMFHCVAVVVSQEPHKEGGYHFHVGMKIENASRFTAVKTIRNAFSEFEGKQCNVSFHKGWNSVCKYLLKQDQSPLCWGESLEEIRS